MDEQPLYRYTPLAGQGWIRVLTVSSREVVQNEQTVFCKLDDCDLEHGNHDGYVALSYSWATPDGDSSKSHTIYIGARRMPVTKNLFLGLLRIWKPDRSIRLWIDAVCINQANIQERNEQVAQMSRIYACASVVFAWLGDGDDEQAMCVLNCLGKANNKRCRERHAFRVSDGSVLDLCELRQQGTWTTDLKGRGYLDVYKIENDKNRQVYVTDMAKIVRGLLDTRYFSRRWIVQEIYHARDVHFFWGSCDFSLARIAGCLQSLLDLANECVNEYSDVIEPLKAIRGALNILEMRQDADREGKVVPFHEIVANTAPLACSDPRDIIFALTSLCPNCGLQPDYNMSVAAVYTSFSRQLVRHGMFELLLQNLQASNETSDQPRHSHRISRIFARAAHTSDDDLADLPSWALDLQKGFRLFSPHVNDWIAPPNDNAHGLPISILVNPEEKSLTCCVYFIGTIAKKTKDDSRIWFRLLHTTANGKYNQAEARIKIEFPDAPLATKGDVVVAFDQSGSPSMYLYHVMVLRKAKDREAYRLLHWRWQSRQESVDSYASPRRVEEKTVITIV